MNAGVGGTVCDRAGRLVKSGCGTPKTWLTTRGTSAWSFALKKQLAPGSYTLWVRAVDSAGAVETPKKASFRVIR